MSASAATSSLVKIVQGNAYGFNAVTAVGRFGFSSPKAITYIGGRVWVANSGTNSMTEISAG